MDDNFLKDRLKELNWTPRRLGRELYKHRFGKYPTHENALRSTVLPIVERPSDATYKVLVEIVEVMGGEVSEPMWLYPKIRKSGGATLKRNKPNKGKILSKLPSSG